MSVRIGFGLTNYPFDDPKGFFRWAEFLETSGVDSVWQADRLVSTDNYLEALSVVAVLAGYTEKIKFGMNAVVAPLRNPLVMAKQCATIDYLSGGRMLPMFGVGYPNAAEWQAMGIDPEHRGALANEMFELVARLWSEESVTFEGRFFQYRNAAIAPRPIQDPLPLWIGGNSKAAQRRTARFGTGWMGGVATPEQVGSVIAGIKTELKHTGRHIDDDHYGASIAYRVGAREDPAVTNSPLIRRPGVGDEIDLDPLFCIGTTDDLIERLKAYIAVGVSKFVLFPIAQGEQDVFDQTRRVIEEVKPIIED